jgi:hypothetical protein
VLGYVHIQIVNLSLEEDRLQKQTDIGVASPVKINEARAKEGHEKFGTRNMTVIKIVKREVQGNFKRYVEEKLAHLNKKDQRILGDVLWKCKHLFYGLGSKELWCTSQVKHRIDTGEARPIKRNRYRIPHALKPVVDEHIDEML